MQHTRDTSRLGTALFSAALLAGCADAPEGDEPSAQPLLAASAVQVSVQPPPQHPGVWKGLDIRSPATKEGDRAQLWALRDVDNDDQLWFVEPIGDSTYHLRLKRSGMCLDQIDWGRGGAGAVVQQWPCHFGANQRWRFEGAVGQWGRLRNVASGRCLDVTDFGFDDGTELQVWDCANEWNQKWNIW